MKKYQQEKLKNLKNFSNSFKKDDLITIEDSELFEIYTIHFIKNDYVYLTNGNFVHKEFCKIVK